MLPGGSRILCIVHDLGIIITIVIITITVQLVILRSIILHISSKKQEYWPSMDFLCGKGCPLHYSNLSTKV